MNTVSFNCNACGKCCNSAPLMSLPELLQHEELFVGCLAIRRVKRHTCGDILAAAEASVPVSPEDAAQWAEIADTALFRIGGTEAGRYDFSIMTQAMDYESLGQCPALRDDNRCGIHENRKPAVCSVVPFEALYPDGTQGMVLLNRKLEEHCIVGGRRDGYPVVVRGRRVESKEYRQALTQRRDDLRLEKQWWGNAVFSMLRDELFCNSAALARIPVDGFFSLSIVPVLIVLAGFSETCRDRCLQYIDSQIALIDRKVNLAISRRSYADKPSTREFRSFREAYLKVRPQLQMMQHSISRGENRLDDLEKYLGL